MPCSAGGNGRRGFRGPGRGEGMKQSFRRMMEGNNSGHGVGLPDGAGDKLENGSDEFTVRPGGTIGVFLQPHSFT